MFVLRQCLIGNYRVNYWCHSEDSIAAHGYQGLLGSSPALDQIIAKFLHQAGQDDRFVAFDCVNLLMGKARIDPPSTQVRQEKHRSLADADNLVLDRVVDEQDASYECLTRFKRVAVEDPFLDLTDASLPQRPRSREDQPVDWLTEHLDQRFGCRLVLQGNRLAILRLLLVKFLARGVLRRIVVACV